MQYFFILGDKLATAPLNHKICNSIPAYNTVQLNPGLS